MSEFAPIVHPNEIAPRLSPQRRGSPVYKKLEKSGGIGPFYEGLSGLINTAAAKYHPDWKLKGVLDLYNGAVFEDPNAEDPIHTQRFNDLVNIVDHKRQDDSEELIWMSFGEVVNVLKAGCRSWEEFKEKTKKRAVDKSIPEKLPGLAI